MVASMLALIWPCLVQAGNTYTLNADFDKGNLKGVNHDAPGINQLQISLDKPPLVDPYLWVANYAQDTVTKIDTRTGRQVAIYDSVLAKNWDGSIPPVPAPRSGCNSPSRTTVDAAGNAFVANRGFCTNGSVTIPSVTKFGGPGQCVDRNGNGKIDTSQDADSNGLINISNPAEYLGQADECILWTRTYAAPGDHGRSVAVDADQNLWLGGYATSKLHKLSNKTGELLQIIDPNKETGLYFPRIYGIAIGPGGFIYTSDINYGAIQRIDPNAPEGTRVKVLYSPVATYGIAVDKHGIVWLGNWSYYRNGGVVRVDFNAGAGTVNVMPVPSTVDCSGGTRGIAVDGEGDIWAACYLNNRLLRFNSAGTFLGSYPTAAGTLGVAIANDNTIWTANQNSNTVTRVHPGVSIQSYPAGGHPYSYWDMTGFQHRHFTMREGDWTVVQDGGKPGTTWGYLHWNLEPQGSTPAGTSIRMFARAADDLAALESQEFVEVSNHTLFSGMSGRHLQVKALLRTTLPTVSPVLSDVTILPKVCWKDVTVNLPEDSPTDQKIGILQHKAVLLKSGEVLSIGGTNPFTTRLYHPVTGWSTTKHTDPPWYNWDTRRKHTATVLLDGDILVAGGLNGESDATARVYDADGTREWTSTGNMNQGRTQHTATLLPDSGRVLVVGGNINDPDDFSDNGTSTATAELYNPAGTWTPTGSLVTARRHHTATLLPDGRVLVTGGYGSGKVPLASAEVYNPATGLWTAVGDMSAARVEHTATLLPDGRVLVAGGSTTDIVGGSSTDIFDWRTNTWAPAGSMKQPRARHAAVLLKTGMVLVTGGYNDYTPIQDSVELYNPVTGLWYPTCSMNYPRERHTMTVLDTGDVLVISGDSKVRQGSAELLSP
ncbi:kelch repeat-containing protein [Archangium sp.]|jgi:streptogramin lyase|uniref:kelch repeat-containing protein n=1 Tax=Archangium sp. TaxID=1872627 RepID=UPI002ED7EEA3